MEIIGLILAVFVFIMLHFGIRYIEMAITLDKRKREIKRYKMRRFRKNGQ